MLRSQSSSNRASLYWITLTLNSDSHAQHSAYYLEDWLSLCISVSDLQQAFASGSVVVHQIAPADEAD